jgi:hypothetical protein
MNCPHCNGQISSFSMGANKLIKTPDSYLQCPHCDGKVIEFYNFKKMAILFILALIVTIIFGRFLGVIGISLLAFLLLFVCRDLKAIFPRAEKYIIMKSFQYPWEAEEFKSRLESEDIPVIIENDLSNGMNVLRSGAFSGVNVLVPERCVEQAKLILSSYEV